MRPLQALLIAALASRAAAAGTVTGTVSVTDKGGRRPADLSDTVVYLEGGASKPRPARVTMTMKGKAFTPHVVIVPVGGTVEFPNQDPIFHNVFSVSGENRFDLELYKRPKSGAWTARAPGIVRVFCNIHPQMSAILVVRDSPHYTKANGDGSFVIEGVPAGKYTLKAWHERGGETSLQITVPAEGQTSARLELDASSYQPTAHKNKFGKDYAAPGSEKY